MPPRYTFTSSYNGQAGTLNSATYNPGTALTARPIASTATGKEHMDAGIYTNIVLKNARGRLLYANPQWVQQVPLQTGHQPKAIMFRFSELDFNDGTKLEDNPAVFKLAEGVTPEHDFKMTVSQIEITAEQYGLVMYWTDIINQVSYIQFKAMATERLGWGLGRIIDAIVKLHYVNNLPELDFSGTAEGAGPISWLRLLRMRTKLEAMDITPPTSEGEFYPLIVHPNQIADLLRDTDIRDEIKHSNTGWNAPDHPMVHPSRLGEAAGFRFYRTTRCATYDAGNGGSTVDGYLNLTVGRDLIAATSLQSAEIGNGPNLAAAYNIGGADGTAGTFNNNASSPVALIEMEPGSSGSAVDPLKQVGSIGAKMTFGLKLVQPTYGYKAKFTSAYMT